MTSYIESESPGNWAQEHLPHWVAVMLSPIWWVLGFSGCKRCGAGWALVKSHETRINFSSGFFALCEHCWEQVTPDAAEALYEACFGHNPDWYDWPQIRQALRAELDRRLSA